jgi:hypothetical protein
MKSASRWFCYADILSYLGSNLRIHGIQLALLFNYHGVLRKGNTNSAFQHYLSFDTFVLFSTFTYSGRPTAQLAFRFMSCGTGNCRMVEHNGFFKNFLPVS